MHTCAHKYASMYGEAHEISAMVTGRPPAPTTMAAVALSAATVFGTELSGTASVAVAASFGNAFPGDAFTSGASAAGPSFVAATLSFSNAFSADALSPGFSAACAAFIAATVSFGDAISADAFSPRASAAGPAGSVATFGAAAVFVPVLSVPSNTAPGLR
jgi:hypothetical protein